MSLPRALFMVLLLACVVLAARVGEQYGTRIDVTGAGIHTLSDTAEQALNAIGGGLEMPSFEPDLPVQRANLERQLAPYLAHTSGPQLRYIDPERDPGAAKEHRVARLGELHLHRDSRREVVYPVTPEAIDQALNRLALQGQRWVVSFIGHGEALIDESPDGLARLASHLETLGYRMLSLDPRQIEQVPDNTALLLIAAPSRDYPAPVVQMIGDYLTAGGRILWLTGEADSPLPATLAVRRLPGTVVDAAAARYGLERPDNAIVSEWPTRLLPQSRTAHAVLHRAHALDTAAEDAWQQIATLRSSPMSWNETGGLSGRVRRDPDQDERQGPLAVGAAFEAVQADGTARVMVLGSPQLFGNTQIGIAGNLELGLGLVRWLTGNAALGSDTGTADLEIGWSQATAGWVAIGLMAGLPLAYIATGLWLRRRRRRA